MDVSYYLSPVNLPSEGSSLSSSGIEITPFGYATGSQQRLYPLYNVSLRTSVYDFPDVINLMYSATIVTSAHMVILLLSLHFFYRRQKYRQIFKYIYIYICVCVCVCVCAKRRGLRWGLIQQELNNKTITIRLKEYFVTTTDRMQ